MLEGTYQGTPDAQEKDRPEGRTFWPKGRPVQGLKVNSKGRVAGSKRKTAGVKRRAAGSESKAQRQPWEAAGFYAKGYGKASWA